MGDRLSHGEARLRMMFGDVALGYDTNTVETTATFYVDKRYSGCAQAVISQNNITSPNAGYYNQMVNAVIGDMNAPYPCPYSARNAALKALAAGSITKAVIVVPAGQRWTVGSDNAVNNGALDKSVNTGVVADLQFAADQNSTGASMLFPNVFSYWGEDSGFDYIWRTGYAIRLGYYSDSTHPYVDMGIFGRGVFRQIWGYADGAKNTGIVYAFNHNAYVRFEAKNVLHQWASYALSLYVGKAVCEIETMTMGDGTVFPLHNFTAGLCTRWAKPTLQFRLKELYWGTGWQGVTDVPDDHWSLLACYGKVGNFILKVDIDVLRMNTYGGNRGWMEHNGADTTDEEIYFNIGTLVEKNRPTFVSASSSAMLDWRVSSGSGNNIFKINIGTARITNALTWFLGGFQFCDKSVFEFNCPDLVRESAVSAHLFMIHPTSDGYDYRNIITGNFCNSKGAVIATDGPAGTTNNTKVILRGTFKTKDAVWPVISHGSPAYKFSFCGVVLVTPNANSITAQPNTKIAVAGLVMNAPLHANVTPVGYAPVVDADIINFV